MSKIKLLFETKQNLNKNKNIRHMILTSFFGILIFGLCLVGTTWAWYQLNIDNKTELTAGSFDIDVEIKDSENAPIEEISDYSFELRAKIQYNMTINSDNDKSENRYILVTKMNESDSETVGYIPYNHKQFIFLPKQDGIYSFEPGWGEFPSTDKIEVSEPHKNDQSSIKVEEKKNPLEDIDLSIDSEYIVKSGDTLEMIAEKYQIAVEGFISYNKLESNELTEGQILQIPSDDYKVNSNN